VRRGDRLLGVNWHEATTAVLPAAYPFLTDNGLGAPGVYVGRDLLGGSFCFDPFTLYEAGRLTNPNMLVAGQVGSGKSSFVKTFLFRQAAFGRPAWVADPKGEYAALAEAEGGVVIRVGPGLAGRLNPLDAPPTGDADGLRLRLLLALATTALGRPLNPLEYAALDAALIAVARSHATPLLQDVVDALLNPAAEAALSLCLDPRELVERSRDAALVLRRMCAGDLAGMFDAPTTVQVHPSCPLVVLDLSAVYQTNKDALPLVLACATSWLQNAIAATPGTRRLVVVDEAWALLSHLGTAQWLQQSFKLSRAYGVANVAVLHRLSDLTAAGDAGSHAVSLAQGLLADTGTRIVYAQPTGEVHYSTEQLGLSGTEASLLPQLRQGVALWKVGTCSFLVEHRRSSVELALSDTDAAMTGRVTQPKTGDVPAKEVAA
jgi:type IV secretory pathway VirB4 component